jgi:predicted phage terminase large subunit-like protein
MPTRVNNPKTCAFIVIMQRVHEFDTTGLIFEKDLGYTRFVVPMHYDPDHPHANKLHQWKGWSGDPRADMDPKDPKSYHDGAGTSGLLAFPEYYDAKDVESLTKKMMAWGGMYSVAGQLEQRPEPRGGGMVKEDWFEIVDEVPSGYGTRCRGWDFASTEGGEGAGSASLKIAEFCTPDGQSDLCVEDVWWDRVSPGDLYDMIRQTVKADGYDVFQSLPQDPGQAGKYQVNDLLDLFAGYDFEFSLESGDKVARFRPIAAQAETRARIGRKIKVLRRDWNQKFFDHVTKFPMGRFKDIPDAFSRGYGGLVKRGGGSFLIGGSTLVHVASASN